MQIVFGVGRPLKVFYSVVGPDPILVVDLRPTWVRQKKRYGNNTMNKEWPSSGRLEHGVSMLPNG
jgi:hypothetical protein